MAPNEDGLMRKEVRCKRPSMVLLLLLGVAAVVAALVVVVELPVMVMGGLLRTRGSKGGCSLVVKKCKG